MHEKKKIKNKNENNLKKILIVFHLNEKVNFILTKEYQLTIQSESSNYHSVH